MRRIFRPRSVIQFGLFVTLVATLAYVFQGQRDYASIAYPPIPQSHYKFIEDAVKHCKVPNHKRGLIAAMAWKESTFNPSAQSGAGAIGVMQLLRGTGLGTANEYQIGGLNAATFTDPSISYKLGTCYMHSLVTRLGGDDPAAWDNEKVLKGALIGYNAGPARGASFLAGSYRGPTSSLGYADRILQAEKVYNLDFARYDQQAQKEGSSIDVLTEVRDIIWNILLKQDSKDTESSS